jgi:ketosteroid isomerase-like protein
VIRKRNRSLRGGGSRRAAVAVLVLTSLPACGTAADGFGERDTEAIRSNLRTYMETNPLDRPDAFFAQFTEDVHWIYAENEPWVGQQGLRAVEWCGTNAAEITPERVEGSGDLAYARGTYELSLDCGGDEPLESEGVFLSAHRRQADGSWRVESMLQMPRAAP